MAITPDKITAESFGNMKLLVAEFSTADVVDDGETWVSGLPNALAYWFNATNDGTQTNEAVDVSFSAGTFTFNTGEDNRTGTLYVLTKS